MNIEQSVNNFLAFAMEKDTELENLGQLIAALDELAYSLNHVNFNFDEAEYPEAPKSKYSLIREKIQKRFPNLGYYIIPLNVVANIEKGELSVGDAIDDLSDIVIDLIEVKWCFENTSKEDALWHYQNSFRYHWGGHLRSLQLYLHEKYY